MQNLFNNGTALDALASIASKVQREWGDYGYRVHGIEGHGYGSALAMVGASDGSIFYVGSTEYGNTVHHEQYAEAVALLAARVAEDRKP